MAPQDANDKEFARLSMISCLIALIVSVLLFAGGTWAIKKMQPVVGDGWTLFIVIGTLFLIRLAWGMLSRQGQKKFHGLIPTPPQTYLMEQISRLKNPQDMQRRIQLCRQGLSITDREVQPIIWGSFQSELASSLLDNPLGNRSENIEQAIYHCRLAVETVPVDDLDSEIVTPEFTAELRSTLQNLLGTAYSYRIQGEPAANQDEAIQCYEESLKFIPREAHLEEWVFTRSNLASMYSERLLGDRAKNIEIAIEGFQEALAPIDTNDSRTLVQEWERDKWAGIHQNLGTVFDERICGNKSDNLEQAIYHYRKALEIYTRSEYPNQWAMVQHNLAGAFAERIRGDRADNIEQAIECSNQALEIRTRRQFPEYWAMTMNNLGDLYCDRIFRKKEENIEIAIKCLESALEIYSFETYPEQWAHVQASLGASYLKREKGARAANIQQTIKYNENSLKVYSAAAYSDKRTKSYISLANAYSQMDDGDQNENIRKAISYYELALSDVTKESYPEKWALIQNNLGLAYSNRRIIQTEETELKAIQYFQNALDLYTPRTFPDSCRSTALNLGNLFLGRNNWHSAVLAYNLAREADEILFSTALLRESKEIEIATARQIYPRAAYALAKCGELSRAIEILEAGRARLLTDSLVHSNASIEKLTAHHPNLATRFQEITQELKNLQDQELSFYSAAFGPLLKNANSNQFFLARTTEQVIGKLDTLLDEIRTLDGYTDFLLPVSFELICTAAKSAPIVFTAISPVGGLALILTSFQEITPVWLDTLTDESLYKHIYGHSLDEIAKKFAKTGIPFGKLGGYLGAYLRWRECTPGEYELMFAKWLEQLDTTTHWLWQNVMGKIVMTLQSNEWKEVVMIPQGLLGLLPLHAAWNKKGGEAFKRTYALDIVNIRYTPNAQAILFRTKTKTNTLPRILHVDYLGKRYSSGYSVAQALERFPKKEQITLSGEEATKQIVLEQLAKSDMAHFACHGIAEPNNPLDGGLELADGKLSLREILLSDLGNPKLVVLSACETAIPGSILPDEMIALPTGFIQAGVDSVIGTLWMVADVSTAILMSKFYEVMMTGVDAQGALYQAQLWLRTSTKNSIYQYASEISDSLGKDILLKQDEPTETIFGHPYWWGGFTYTSV